MAEHNSQNLEPTDDQSTVPTIVEFWGLPP